MSFGVSPVNYSDSDYEKCTFINPQGALLRQMIDRILKTYGEVNTTVKHFPPENNSVFFFM